MFLIRDLSNANEGEAVEFHGWLQDLRSLKNITFLIVRDHTGIIQVTAKKDEVPEFDSLASIPRESVVRISGKFTANSKSKSGMEIICEKCEVLNYAESPLPLGVIDPVKADIETRLNSRYLDLRKQEVGIIFRAESDLLWGIREFLNRMNFVEVHTPKIVASATEGGADLFKVEYFEKQAFLNQSPQLYKEILISAGLNRVFEVGPAFRAEKHNTPRHLNEFTSIDIEMAFSDHNDAMNMLQDAVVAGVKHLMSRKNADLKTAGYELPEVDEKFPRITYRECIDMLSKKGSNHKFGDDFSPEELKIIGENFSGFYFITEWPSSLRAFYTMPKPGDKEVSNSFDLQYREFEITSGAQRVHNAEMLSGRLREQGLNPEDFSYYLNAFRYGMPPHAGWAIGLERLSLILLKLQNIREVVLFPRDRTRITP